MIKLGLLNSGLSNKVSDSLVKIRFRGANEEQAAAADFLSTAFSLAMSVMMIMLVMQFNSFYQAGLILFSVVLSTAGVLLGLLIAQATFSTVLTGVGVVALAGIVVNNNIVLIDTYNYLRRHNPLLTSAEAVYTAAKSRFQAGDVDYGYHGCGAATSGKRSEYRFGCSDLYGGWYGGVLVAAIG